MQTLDWLIVLIPFVIVMGIAWYTMSYTRSVADFMAGGRCAGRYLICSARGETLYGVATAVAIFELVMQAGFTQFWWGYLLAPVQILIAISGFVLFRYRETRAMTLAQFFEIRYSKNFRIFAGILAFVAGVLTFGVGPIVTAYFFIFFCGFPKVILIFSCPVETYIVLMVIFMLVSTYLTVAGGQVTLLITDCIEGLLSHAFYLVVVIALFCIISWSQVCEVMIQAPSGQSLVNPLDTFGLPDFNLWYILMIMFTTVYGTMAWQGGHAFNSSALTPHESRMGNILGQWRLVARGILSISLAICAITFMKHPDFAMASAPINGALQSIDNHEIQRQMRIPTALNHLLPMGIKGVLCAIMLFGTLSGMAQGLHSWGSIFIQDVVVPLRKKTFSLAEHLFWLRFAMVAVAATSLLLSFILPQKDYLLMLWIIINAVYVAGAGSAIIGGLYWKKGTTPAAWATMITGATLSLAGYLLKPQPGKELLDDPGGILGWFSNFHLDFLAGFNLQHISVGVMLISIAVYVIVSLLTCRQNFNMDRMLHRGKYAIEGDSGTGEQTAAKKFSLGKLMGIDANFTRGDKIVAGGIFYWTIFWVAVFIVGTAWYMVRPWKDSFWLNFWYIKVFILPFLICVGTLIWFTIGGVRDMKLFFQKLRVEKRDTRDDGTVVHHHNLDEERRR